MGAYAMVGLACGCTCVITAVHNLYLSVGGVRLHFSLWKPQCGQSYVAAKFYLVT